MKWTKSLESVEDLQLTHFLYLVFCVVEVGRFLKLSLLESSQIVKAGPSYLLFDQQVVIGSEQSVQILPVLALQEEDFQNDLLLQPGANVAYDACLKRLFD